MIPQLVHEDLTARRVQIPSRFSSDKITSQAAAVPSVAVNSHKTKHNVKNYFKRIFMKRNNVDFKSHNKDLDSLTTSSSSLSTETEIRLINSFHLLANLDAEQDRKISAYASLYKNKSISSASSQSDRMDYLDGMASELGLISEDVEMESYDSFDESKLPTSLPTTGTSASLRSDYLDNMYQEIVDLGKQQIRMREYIENQRGYKPFVRSRGTKIASFDDDKTVGDHDLSHFVTSKTLLSKPKKSILKTPSISSASSGDIRDDGASTTQDDSFGDYELPKRKAVNKIVKDRTTLTAHNRLLNFLRVKYFMKRRDITTMNNMVADGRTWLLKNKYTCERKLDYEILTTSVSLAFMVTAEELDFRQLMKNKTNYDNMAHINATLDGDLGKTAGASTYGGESFGRSMLRNLPFPKSNIVI